MDSLIYGEGFGMGGAPGAGGMGGMQPDGDPPAKPSGDPPEGMTRPQGDPPQRPGDSGNA